MYQPAQYVGIQTQGTEWNEMGTDEYKEPIEEGMTTIQQWVHIWMCYLHAKWLRKDVLDEKQWMSDNYTHYNETYNLLVLFYFLAHVCFTFLFSQFNIWDPQEHGSVWNQHIRTCNIKVHSNAKNLMQQLMPTQSYIPVCGDQGKIVSWWSYTNLDRSGN